jgi:hypothetical protein
MYLLFNFLAWFIFRLIILGSVDKARIWFGLDLLWQHGVENRHNFLVNIGLAVNIPGKKILVIFSSSKVNNY